MLDGGMVHRLTDAVCGALSRDEPVAPLALALLLDRYAIEANDDLGQALGRGLARALEMPIHDAPPRERASWARLFASATMCSDDARIGTVARELADWLHSAIAAGGPADPSLVDGALDVCGRLDRPDLLLVAVERLEELMTRRYVPGEGLIGPLDDQITSTLALAAAFGRTERVPYAMLAEELMRSAIRTRWLDGLGAFGPGSEPCDMFPVNCQAARACCRLARLERSPLYQAYAVANGTAEYLTRAGTLLQTAANEALNRGADAAVFGLALADWLDLQ